MAKLCLYLGVLVKPHWKKEPSIEELKKVCSSAVSRAAFPNQQTFLGDVRSLKPWLPLTIVISLNVQALSLVGWCIWRFNVSSTAPGKYPTCPRVKCGLPKFSIHKIYGNWCRFQKCWAQAFGGCFMAQEVPTWRNIRSWRISQKMETA